MSTTTRRDFLKTSALVGGGLLLTDPTSLLAQEATAQANMAITHWDPALLPEADLAGVATRLTEATMEAMGGMGRFVSKGDVVWVKPNIGWNRRPELAANTNPDVVGTLVRLCLEAGAKSVKVGDHTCNPARQCYRTSGIAKAAEDAGARVVYLDKKRFRDVKLGGEFLDEWPLYTEVMDADLVLNVPVLKHHGLTEASMAMKNYMGIIGGQRNAWHQNMAACLCDITRFMKPTITVLDAVRTLTAHGPQGGNPDDVKLVGTMAASTDIVALDAFGASVLGHDPSAISNIQAAHEQGLGTMDWSSLAPVERTLS